MGLFDGIAKAFTGAVSSGKVFDGLGGSLVSGGLSLLGGANQNSAQQAAAQSQMDFQERMSNTSYQRAVADMKAAGLNPALAYSNGGASTPSGASMNAVDALTPAVNSAMAARRLHADVANLEASNRQIQAQTDKTKSDTVSNSWLNAKMKADIANSTLSTASQLRLNSALESKAIADASLSATNAQVQAAQRTLMRNQIPQSENIAAASRGTTGQYIDTVGKIMKTLSPFGSMLNSAKSLAQ